MKDKWFRRHLDNQGVFFNATHLCELEGDSVLKEHKKKLKTYFNNSCAYCGSQKNLTLDHAIPRSSGGEHSKYNLILAVGIVI